MSSISLLFRIRTIHLVLIPVYPSYLSLPPQRLLRLYRLYTFPFLVLRHCITVSLLSITSTHPYFSRPSLFLETALPAAIFLPFLSLFFFHRHHVTRFPPWIHPLYFSISSCFLPRIHRPVFPTQLASFHVSTFPSLLRCPSGRSTLFSDSHQLFLDAALSTEVRGAPFPTPAGYNRRYLRAQHVHRSILAHLRSCQAGYIPADASTPYPARLRVRSHYTLPRG